LYGQDEEIDRNKLAREVIDYEIDLLKNDQIFEKWIISTLVLCNKILDKHALEKYYQEVKNMLRNARKISTPCTYVPARCRGEPYVRPRTNNAFVPMYDGRT
jgi:hypothetical protein